MDVTCILPDEFYADLPPGDRAIVRWCAEEVDLTSPYHDAWYPDGVDTYATDIPTRSAGAMHALTSVALMCDATHGFVS